MKFISITGKTRNLIYYIVLVTGFLGLMLAGFQTSLQNSYIDADYQAFAQAKQMLQSNQPDQAQAMLQPLLNKYKNSFEIAFLYAVALDGQKKYKESLKYLDKARQIRPVLQVNQRYLIQYGQILESLGRISEAKVYFQAAVNLNNNPQDTKSARKLLGRLENK
ncbi:MAG: hypothetical protein ACM3UZ_15255 [Acidobacteriota bacterium]